MVRREAVSGATRALRCRVWHAVSITPWSQRRGGIQCEYVTGNGGTWDNGYTHAWTQVRAVLRPRGIVHRKAPRVSVNVTGKD
eukprot:1913322-Prymnesium_polylepis.1